jgi:eukaryotic-like serine/threonine-protein kinase
VTKTSREGEYSLRRFFTLLLGALAMLTVALLSAFLSMRLAIHGREVDVPALTGLTVADAYRLASHSGLNLTLENRFYSADVPAGRVLAQSPAQGSRVRRDWPVRITESLGAQHVSIPDLTGESERSATINIRRLSLEQGVVAHLPIAGDADVVLAQTPTATSAGVTGPRVSLLVSDPSLRTASQTYVMPSLVGLSYGAAAARASALGVRLAVAAPEAEAEPGSDGAAAASSPASAGLAAPVVSASPSGAVIAQSPPPGRRINRGDVVHVSLGHPAGAAAPQSSNQTPAVP